MHYPAHRSDPCACEGETHEEGVLLEWCVAAQRSADGQGLRLLGERPQGIDWNAHKDLITHPFTMELVLVPTDTNSYRRLFRYDDGLYEGWYYGDYLFYSYANDPIRMSANRSSKTSATTSRSCPARRARSYGSTST